MSTSEKVVELEKVVIKFAGDSGDGMQLTGSQFTDTSALLGNDIATFPDFPAEIRAPAGTVAGVSGFQVHIGHIQINTPGDQPDVLVAMNPAALMANIKWVRPNGTIIVDTDNFKRGDFKKADLETNPLEDGTVEGFQVIEAPITSMTKEALKDLGLDNKSRTRCKNMFCLGIVYWMFNRPTDQTKRFLARKFKHKPEIVEANTRALEAGFSFAETIELLPSSYTVLPADLEMGTYRNITGNQATAWGLMAAAQASERTLFLGTYPITPASDILHELAKHKYFGTRIFQAEDEIAGVCAAIGASFSGALGCTSTSGPGLALKSEAIGLAVSTELPLVVINVQRGGPSTGLPTKTEQSDLMQALYGRNGESPTIVIAASTPSNCYDYSYMACKLAMEHMTPVILLSDGYLANGAEPWKIKSTSELPDINPPILKATDGQNGQPAPWGTDEPEWLPYLRDPEKMNRYWAVPGTPGFEHRIGGLEKDSRTGNVSYVPENHELMCKTREEKVQRVAQYIPEQEVLFDQSGDLLIVGWGGTFGHLFTAVSQCHSEGMNIGMAHFNYIKPLPRNTAEIFRSYKHILVCELNLGQFVNYLRSELPDFHYDQINKIQGLPFSVTELRNKFTQVLSKS